MRHMHAFNLKYIGSHSTGHPVIVHPVQSDIDNPYRSVITHPGQTHNSFVSHATNTSLPLSVMVVENSSDNNNAGKLYAFLDRE